MQTEYLIAVEDPLAIPRAAELLREGKLVAIPTETVYGLAADALNGPAVARIFSAKGRPQDNPLIVHIAKEREWGALVREIPPAAHKLAERFWPGPLTVILEKSDIIPEEVSAGLSTVAVRCPSHPAAQAVIRAACRPLAAPSANLSGRPSPTTAERVMEDMKGRIEAVLDGGPCAVGVESTVLSLVGGMPRLLRPGGITAEQIEQVLETRVEIDPAVTDRLAPGRAAASPGMKYKHYSPKARVIMVKGTEKQFADFVNAQKKEGMAALCFEEDKPNLLLPYLSYGAKQDASAQAHTLFEALRALDDAGYSLIYAHSPSAEGVGLAVYNRLIRAAGFEVLTLV